MRNEFVDLGDEKIPEIPELARHGLLPFMESTGLIWIFGIAITREPAGGFFFV